MRWQHFLFVGTKKNMGEETTEALVIAILVIVCVILLILVEVYRNILSITTYYFQESPLPPELRFSSSFLAPSNSNKSTKK
jgi:hypothetical protein